MSENGEKKEMNTESALTTDRRDPSFWREAYQQARLVFYLLRDPEVPFYLKLLPFAAVFYLLWPADLIPGLILPIVGSLDDITALLVGAKVFIELAPQHVVIKHLNTIRQLDGYDPIEDEIKMGDTAVNDDLIIDGEIIEEKEPE